MPGAKVESFADPIKALEWSKDNIPDIVISDSQMGAMNGASFTAALLDLQVVTVKLHMKGILRKLGTSNRTHAVKIVLELRSAA